MGVIWEPDHSNNFLLHPSIFFFKGGGFARGHNWGNRGGRQKEFKFQPIAWASQQRRTHHENITHRYRQKVKPDFPVINSNLGANLLN
jgi:hypothetical protein